MLGGVNLSQEKIVKTLTNFGFTKNDATVYIYLAKKGPKKGSEIIKTLKMPKQQLYPIIKNLQRKGIVSSTFERPARFSAVTFDKVIDLFTEAKMEEIKRIQNNKNQLLSEWESIHIKENEEKIDKFAVLEGRKFIYSKIRQMAQEAKNKFCVVFPLSTLIRLDKYGVFDAVVPKIGTSNVNYCFITDSAAPNTIPQESIYERRSDIKFSVRVRNPNFGLKLFPNLVIKDNEEILLFIKPRIPNATLEADENSLWTNCKSIIDSFQCVFDDLWKNSATVEEAKNIETRRLHARTKNLNDSEFFEKNLMKIFTSAENEITSIFSIDGLTYFLKKLYPLRNWKNTDVTIKVMAPITRENYIITQNLAKLIDIRHLSETNLETIIVDGKHIFQFNLSKSAQDDVIPTSFLENTFYSNDYDFVLKMKLMLENLWVNSQVLSQFTLDSLFEKQADISNVVSDQSYTFSKPDSPYRKMIITYEEKPKMVTEKEVLTKIFQGKKHLVKNILNDKAVFYGCRATALIHTPDFFNLPEMIISVSHWNENSSFGSENWIVINLLTETSNGHKFIPTALIQNHSVGLNLKKDIYAGTPAAENIQLLEKDEFKILVYEKTLFAGWTKPLLLVPEKYVLPPACLIFEGYGNVKSGVINSIVPSGRKNNWQYNGFEAFVTFYHPSSKYSGSGIDGTISREVILTSYRNIN